MRWLGKGSLRFCRGQKGLTLIEVVIAVGILSFIGTGVVMGLDTNARAGRVLDEQVTATNLATAYIEAIRVLPYDNTGDTYSDAGAGITLPPQYTVDIDAECSADGEIFGPCTDSANETLQLIRISISHGGKPVFLMCTYKTDF